MGKDVTIKVPTAVAGARAPVKNIQHHCPVCDKTFGWEEFQAHAMACIESHPERVKEILGGGS